ncbi:MAG TPA: hypothetical protein VLL51_05330, partial [Gemmatimonadales bacterium]|nr:hypothetical protein [Gemmatimonadales bacterium]
SGPVDLTGGPILLVTAPAAGTRVVVPGDYLECRPAASDTGAAAAEARAAGTGLLLSFGSPAEALDHLERALGAAHLAALDPVCMAVDPGWGPGRGEHDLARFRAFGVPLVTTTDHPAVAAMAWERGCRLFRTGAAAEVLAALEMTITLLP